MRLLTAFRVVPTTLYSVCIGRRRGLHTVAALPLPRLRDMDARPMSLRPSRQALLIPNGWCGYAKFNKVVNLPRLRPRAAGAAAGGDFYSADGVEFSSLGISSAIEAALHAQNFLKPSRVQELVIPVVSKGQTAVVAAETGSGKTLAYLAPVASMLLRQKERMLTDLSQRRYHALILCPNIALCQQVLSVALSLQSPAGEPLLSAACINASNPPPQTPPDIIISTPAALLGFIGEAGPSYGFLWTPEGLQSKVRHVVLDEADLLLGRAFDRPVKQLLQLLRTGDRRRVEAKVFEELGIDKREFDRLPRPMMQACWSAGSQGLQDAGYRVPGGWAAHESTTFGPYWRRQYMFVAATMPSITLSDVGSEIQRMFPDVQWVSSELLHQSKPRLQHSWHEVADDTFRGTLVRAICGDPDYASGTAKVLVFAADVASADQVSELLQGEGLPHWVYHKNRPMQERADALEAMAGPRTGQARIMVCTDAAARGLDIQDISHVIQADFAANAIDFIHRIGRTGRADRSGRVTSLYRKNNVPLVQVLQQYVEEGRPLEAAFSRARSFSRKFKRAGGEFIPRGFTKSQFNKAMGSETEDSEVQGSDSRISKSSK